MERRKFLANLVCLSVGVGLAPKALREMEPYVDPKIYQYPLTEEEAFKPSGDFIIGCITSLSDNEITVYPYSKLEEFPALKRGDKAILFPGAFFKTSKDYSRFAHKEENFQHDMIVIQESIPCAGKGNPIIFRINNISHIRLHSSLLFKTK